MNNRKRRVMAALPVGTGGTRQTTAAIHAVKRSDASDALEIAVTWLDRIAGGLDERGQLELRVWLDADEIHRRVLFEMAQVYDEVNVLSSAAAWPCDTVAADRVWRPRKVM